jgi:hypothetical protein
VLARVFPANGARAAAYVGTAVIVLPWRDPVLLAERTATLDPMSGGRLEFGVGYSRRMGRASSRVVPKARPASSQPGRSDSVPVSASRASSGVAYH